VTATPLHADNSPGLLPVRRIHASANSASFWHDLGASVRELGAARDLLYQLTRRDVVIRYKQAAIGVLWALFMPLLIVFSGLMVQVAIASVAGRTVSPASWAAIAVKAVPWAFFVGAIGFATNSLLANLTLVTKVSFPRAVLPLATVIAQAVDTAIALLALAVALPLSGAVPLTGALLWVPFLLLVLVAFTAACAMVLSCANLFFRDVKYIVQVLLTFGIFLTPVFFEPAMFGARGAPLAMVNPLAPLLEGLRLAATQGHNLLLPLVQTSATGVAITVWSPWYLLWTVGLTCVSLPVALVLFHRAQYAFAEYI
jgi:lipopolysaccharide transport system permease protein